MEIRGKTPADFRVTPIGSKLCDEEAETDVIILSKGAFGVLDDVGFGITESIPQSQWDDYKALVKIGLIESI